MKRVLLAVLLILSLPILLPSESTSSQVYPTGEIHAFEALKEASAAKGGVARGEDLKNPYHLKKNQELAKDAVSVYERAVDFVKRFPKSEHVQVATHIGLRELATAVEAGDQQMKPVLEKWVAEVRKDPSVPEETKIEFAWTLITALNPERGVGLENGVRELLQEFPGSKKAYQVALRLAVLRGESARGFFEELAADDKTPAEARASARGFLKRLTILGKPLEISFTALDGREIDVAQLKGKIVLVYFWATWCGPCIGEMPALKAVYDKHHDQGFEIIAINLDDDKKVLETYLNKNQIKWPQHFDGNGWRNKFAVEYGIVGIPVMWLIDKTGTVVSVNIRHNLDNIVAHLLSK